MQKTPRNGNFCSIFQWIGTAEGRRTAEKLKNPSNFHIKPSERLCLLYLKKERYPKKKKHNGPVTIARAHCAHTREL